MQKLFRKVNLPSPLPQKTRNGKKIPVKFAMAKSVPKVPNACALRAAAGGGSGSPYGGAGGVREYVTQQRLDKDLDDLCFALIAQVHVSLPPFLPHSLTPSLL